MAGRQKHKKSGFTERSELSYQNKLIGIFSTYVPVERSEEWVTAMWNNYNKVFGAIYEKVHHDSGVQAVITSSFGSATRFVAYQIINETIYAVLLTRSQTGTTLFDKYNKQGIPADVLRSLIYATTVATMNAIPRVGAGVTSAAGGATISASNIIRILDTYVTSAPPLPASAGGVLGEEQAPTVSPIYEGTTTFSEYSQATAGLQELRTLRARRMLEGV